MFLLEAMRQILMERLLEFQAKPSLSKGHILVIQEMHVGLLRNI